MSTTKKTTKSSKTSKTVAKLKSAAKAAKDAGAAHIGDFVTWDVDALSVPRADVRAAFGKAGQQYADLILDIEPEHALSRAKQVHSSKTGGIHVRTFQKVNADASASLGVSREVEKDGEEGAELVLGARVRIENGQIVAVPRPDGTADDECMTRARQIAETATKLITHASTADVSAAVVQAIKLAGGVALRKRGGAYFVPEVHTTAWRAMSDAIAEVCGATRSEEGGGVAWTGGGFQPTVLELFDSPRTVATVAAAAQSSFEEEIGQLSEDLRKAQDDGYLKRASLTDRIELCESLTARSKLYETVLSKTVDDLRSNVDAVKAGLEKELAAYDTGKRPAYLQVLTNPEAYRASKAAAE